MLIKLFRTQRPLNECEERAYLSAEKSGLTTNGLTTNGLTTMRLTSMCSYVNYVFYVVNKIKVKNS
jgi:hypothetical protein